MMTQPTTERQAVRYFSDQADYWRRQGDSAYAAQMDATARRWAAQEGEAR